MMMIFKPSISFENGGYHVNSKAMCRIRPLKPLMKNCCNTHVVAFDIPPVGTGTIRKDDPTLIRGTESHRNERDPEAV
jgi:hypothetical protein